MSKKACIFAGQGAQVPGMGSDFAADAGIAELFTRAKLPTVPPAHVEPQRIWELMHSDKKTLGGEIRMVLPSALGKVDLVPGITREVFERAWANSAGT